MFKAPGTDSHILVVQALLEYQDSDASQTPGATINQHFSGAKARKERSKKKKNLLYYISGATVVCSEYKKGHFINPEGLQKNKYNSREDHFMCVREYVQQRKC